MAWEHLSSSPLYNEDLAPVPDDQRTWGLWTIASLWVGMAVCIPTYNIASGLISQGFSWKQAMTIVGLANIIVCIPMVLNAHVGPKYGIPFPVFVRASFGTRGANLPALMRALVACGWFGIQTYIGGSAIYTLHAVIFGFKPAGPTVIPLLGLSLGQLACFLLFWVINVLFIVIGTDSIKWLERFSAPFLIVVGLMLLWWATGHEKVQAAGGFSAMLSDETVSKIRAESDTPFDFWKLFWPNLTGMVGFWATLSLNIPDFSRYTRRQSDQVIGQFLGLPTTMILYSFIGIAVTGASFLIFGKAIWDPIELLGKFDSVIVVGFALFALSVATLSTNLAANVVSPANDFSNLAPRLISFKTGGLITAVIGIIIMPWRLSNLGNYIFTWLIGYSALLGAIAGVMLADYFVLRRTELNVEDLYREDGEYSYGGSGWNWRAVVAMMAGIVPCVPGFIEQAAGVMTGPDGAPLLDALGKKIPVVDVPAVFDTIYTYAWFVSLGIAFVLYAVLPRRASSR